MKKLIVSIVFISLVISCGKNKSGNLTVQGNIDGLKKATVYLQKIKDTVFVSVDSVKIQGEGKFTLVDNIDSPEVYFITVDKIENEKIPFFAEKGVIKINSKFDKLQLAAKISGSKNQKLLEEHNAMTKKFNGRKLEIIKEKFEAQKDQNIELLTKIENEEKSLVKRKYLYTTNFAIRHSKYEVAPYLALTDLYYANIKLLDTINKSLSKKIKKSKYGLKLDNFIKNIKESEK